MSLTYQNFDDQLIDIKNIKICFWLINLELLIYVILCFSSYCKCEMPYNPDDLMVQCEGCKDWYAIYTTVIFSFIVLSFLEVYLAFLKFNSSPPLSNSGGLSCLVVLSVLNKRESI